MVNPEISPLNFCPSTLVSLSVSASPSTGLSFSCRVDFPQVPLLQYLLLKTNPFPVKLTQLQSFHALKRWPFPVQESQTHSAPLHGNILSKFRVNNTD